MLTPTPTPTSSPLGTPQAPLLRRRLLIVDDEAVLLRALRRLLAAHHDAVVVSGAEEALALLESDRDFDVVLCDVQMPGLTGPQLCAEVGRRWPSISRRFVFMTAGDCPTDGQRLRLQKPFLLEEALQAIRATIERETV